MSGLATFPHERRVQRYALLVLTGSLLLGALQMGLQPGSLLGLALPAPTPLGLTILGALVGVVAVFRRSSAVALAGAGVMLLGLALATNPATLLAYALALAFAALTLAWVELVHVTQRYEKAHRVVEEEHVPEESLNRVTDETLKTLATRTGFAALLVTAGIAIAYLLRAAGPRQWREAIETTAPVGVAVVTLALFAGLSIFILARGARLRGDTPKKSVEVEIDVAE